MTRLNILAPAQVSQHFWASVHMASGSESTYSLHCSPLLGVTFYRILSIELVKPKQGTTMETLGRVCQGLKFRADFTFRISRRRVAGV